MNFKNFNESVRDVVSNIGETDHQEMSELVVLQGILESNYKTQLELLLNELEIMPIYKSIIHAIGSSKVDVVDVIGGVPSVVYKKQTIPLKQKAISEYLFDFFDIDKDFEFYPVIALFFLNPTRYYALVLTDALEQVAFDKNKEEES